MLECVISSVLININNNDVISSTTSHPRPLGTIPTTTSRYMMTDFRRRFWTILGIVFLSIIIISLICWLLLALVTGGTAKSAHHMDRCAPLLGEAKLASFVSSQEQVKIATPDYRSLVKLVALIRNNDNSDKGQNDANDLKVDKFIPLRLNNVTISTGRSSGESTLVLWTECARLSLNMASDSKQLIVGSIDVESEFKLGDNRRSCVIQSTSIRLTDIGMRYNCNQPTRYQCESGFWHANDTFVMKTLATLEIYSLEFELDGNSTVIKTNQFSKTPEICSIAGSGGVNSFD